MFSGCIETNIYHAFDVPNMDVTDIVFFSGKGESESFGKGKTSLCFCSYILCYIFQYNKNGYTWLDNYMYVKGVKYPGPPCYLHHSILKKDIL